MQLSETALVTSAYVLTLSYFGQVLGMLTVRVIDKLVAIWKKHRR